jgi:hypothetical protein
LLGSIPLFGAQFRALCCVWHFIYDLLKRLISSILGSDVIP